MNINTDINNLAKNIQLLILDVDGVLTNGHIIYDSNGNELKFFNVKDGLAIKQAQKLGIKIAIITARSSEIVQKRAQELNIQYLYQGQKNKLLAYYTIKKELSLEDDNIAYLGDDWPDLPVLKQVRLPALVQDAEPMLKKYAQFITHQKGGYGAVREFIYAILDAQGKLSEEKLLN